MADRAARSAYVYQLCREAALKGDARLMMVRDAGFHGHALVEGALRELRRHGQPPQPQPSIIVPKPVAARPGARGRRQ